ncbi:MAG: hypothetical protein ACI85K_002386 [Hyphomicrobiaceae bacterium]|jgi:hypothetical protein
MLLQLMRHAASCLPVCAGLAFVGGFSSHVRAQGEFVNYEVGGVSPIAIQTFSVGAFSRTVLMACNTANDSLEFYDANSLTFLKRVPTGLSPVTVRWHEDSQRAYTCNYLGDSMTSIEVLASDGGGFVALDIRLKSTFRVGDEPSDVAFVPGQPEAMVSLRSRSAVALVNLSSERVKEARHILDVDNGATDHVAIKNPRNIAFVGGDRFYALDHQSDGVSTDIDLLAAYTPGGGVNPLYDTGSVRFKVNGMGTTHANFAVNAAGDTMFVIGMRSNPTGATTEDAVGLLKTGFTESWLWVVDLNDNLALPMPTVRSQSTGAGSVMPSINLNRNYTTLPSLDEVTPSAALAQPTGIAIVESGGAIEKIVLTLFSSDAVAVLTPSLTSASGWDIQKINMTVLDSSYSMVGPREVVLDAAGDTAYVIGSLDNTLRIVDISSPVAVLGNATSLLFDDTPLVIRRGREFLYGAQHSGSQSVSCSSCHIDGHTDGLAWTLNQGDQGALPNEFINGIMPASWPADKGPLTTQSLRGLVNHDVAGPSQKLFTNEPYHWRGDRKTFGAFNGAFVGLMNRVGGEVSASEMDDFTNFIETVLHPPNPEQPVARTLTGDMGGSGWDPALGTKMQRGLKLYHAMEFPLGCAQCHVLPEGSGNRGTQTYAQTNTQVAHPVEPAALRHIFDREAGLQIGSGPVDLLPIKVKDVGLFHDGFLLAPGGNSRADFSTAHFIQLRFRGSMPGLYDILDPDHVTEQEAQTLDLTSFVRALDTGSAPIIGWAFTCVASSNRNNRVMDLLRGQVEEANAGMVAHTDIGGLERSFWYDLDQDLFRDDSSLQTYTQSALLAQATTGNVIVLQAVPVGSARRIADYGNLGATDAGPAPSNVTLQAMTFPTHWATGGDLQARWDPNSGPQLFGNPVDARESHKRMIYMQEELIAAAATGFDVGVNQATHIKHELPRRFRVAGNDIRPGAELEIQLLGRNGIVVPLRMSIFPTKFQASGNGARIWETTVAADGEMTLALLHGGLFLPNVWDLINFTSLTQPYPALTPATDNNYTFVVHNTDGTSVSGSAPLTVTHVR